MLELNLHGIQLLADFGLVVLIWMVQLIVYPGFRHYTHENLHKWHKSYTVRIGVIVIPLMFVQLIFGSREVVLQASPKSIVYLALVLFTWIHTFYQFAPRHNKIARNTFDQELLNELIAKNWVRTFIWTSIFILQVLWMEK